MEREGQLVIWVVYDHPSDMPSMFVARAQTITREGPVNTDFVIADPDLMVIRRRLHAWGLTRMERHPLDEAVILEMWL